MVTRGLALAQAEQLDTKTITEVGVQGQYLCHRILYPRGSVSHDSRTARWAVLFLAPDDLIDQTVFYGFFRTEEEVTVRVFTKFGDGLSRHF